MKFVGKMAQLMRQGRSNWHSALETYLRSEIAAGLVLQRRFTFTGLR